MKDFSYYQPTEIHFGWGKSGEVGSFVARFGTKCLIVTPSLWPELEKALAKMTESMRQNGVEVFHFSGVVPNPTTDSVDAGVEMAKANGVDVVLGVGGGSAMDTAKAIAVGATHPGRAWDYRLFTGNEITDKVLPIITVSTTSGTGSQVTPVSVVTNPEDKSKFALVDTLLCPRVSIVDPELMLTVPSHITASTGFDVFAHAFESYIHKNASPYTDLLALEAIRLVVENLPTAVNDGLSREAREKMAWADTLAGLCIANAGTTLPHGIGMAIGGHAPHVMHGEALAAVYPEFMDYTWASAVEKFAAVARILDPALAGVSDKEAAEKSTAAITEFLKKIGMWLDLAGLKVPESELEAIADDSVKLPDYEVNPRVATRDEILEMLKVSYSR
ncbi:MAG: iron-containing alcohol dehydrogenase [Firmicutes bacterium]|nr:iron-containing alcohol dehydrogenase [Bacillota bacterium]